MRRRVLLSNCSCLILGIGEKRVGLPFLYKIDIIRRFLVDPGIGYGIGWCMALDFVLNKHANYHGLTPV